MHRFLSTLARGCASTLATAAARPRARSANGMKRNISVNI